MASNKLLTLLLGRENHSLMTNLVANGENVGCHEVMSLDKVTGGLKQAGKCGQVLLALKVKPSQIASVTASIIMLKMTQNF